MSRTTLVLALVAGCGAAPARTPPPTPGVTPAVAVLSAREVVLPGGPAQVRMDFIAYDATAHALWVPAGNTGRVDVLDVDGDGLQAIEGFATSEMQGHDGQPRVVGPSSVAVGDGVVYVGNRGDSRICAIDARTHTVGGCATLASMPDAIALVPAAHELWVTTPRDHAMVVLHVDGVTAPTAIATIPLDGSPECATVDDGRGVFYTNLEDHDRTLAIDVATRQITASWSPGCGEEGPRGLAIDPERRFLFVACTDRVVTLDLAHDGAILGRVPTGGRLDDVDYSATRRMLYVASGADATLRFVRVDDHGGLTVVATAPTGNGARNAVADERGRVYVTDAERGRILVVAGPP